MDKRFVLDFDEDFFDDNDVFFPILEEVEERSRLEFDSWSLDPKEYCEYRSALFCAEFDVFKIVSKWYWFASINDPKSSGKKNSKI